MAPRIYKLTGVRLYFIPIQTRVPLKFGSETVTSVTCARVALQITDENGRQAEGWGETPLSVQWAWPGAAAYAQRHEAMKNFCRQLAATWLSFEEQGHAFEIGHRFLENALSKMLSAFNSQIIAKSGNASRGTDNHHGTQSSPAPGPMSYLAGLICNSPFDIALHDAYGKLAERPVYETYCPTFLRHDLTDSLEPAKDSSVSFSGKYPADFLLARPPSRLPAWHLVGGLDLLDAQELTGQEPDDGYPVVLTDWIQRDGLKCLKVKLRGNDAVWDYARLVRVGEIGAARGVDWLSADFNCTVKEPDYVNQILDRLKSDHRLLWDKLLYVEQPFPYELEQAKLDVRSLSARKPLFLDESAHDWRMVRLGRELGWNGVALKTCKTQTGALLSACWAKAHGLALMVQDLTNPMLAQIPHVLLAAHTGTIMGVETNAMQFYPAASAPEEKVHPALYRRRNGEVDLSTLTGPGFSYRLQDIQRQLPEPELSLAL